MSDTIFNVKYPPKAYRGLLRVAPGRAHGGHLLRELLRLLLLLLGARHLGAVVGYPIWALFGGTKRSREVRK